MKKIMFATLFAVFSSVSIADVINIGELSPDGSVLIQTNLLASREVDFFNFTIGHDVNLGDGSYLNIAAYGEEGYDLLDSELGLYDSNNLYIADDDDGNANGRYTEFYSMLSFGDSDPFTLGTDTIAGEDGILAAGDYTLVVGGYNSRFSNNIFGVTSGLASGDYNLSFSFKSAEPVYEPANIVLLSCSLLALACLRRKNYVFNYQSG